MKKSLNAWFVIRSLPVSTVYITIGIYIIKPSNVNIAWNVLEVKHFLLFTVGYIQVKSLMCVLLVIEDFLQSINYKITRQLTVLRENSNAWYALTTEVLKLNTNWLNTWCIITNQDSLVRNVVRNFILQRIWTHTWSIILNLPIRVENVIRSFILQLI